MKYCVTLQISINIPSFLQPVQTARFSTSVDWMPVIVESRSQEGVEEKKLHPEWKYGVAPHTRWHTLHRPSL